MKSKSVRSTQTIAYKAGFEAGQSLAEVKPEVVFIHSSVHYAPQFPDLFEGMQDGFEGLTPILFGCTGDGIYETAGVSHHGVCALGLNTGGQIQWQTAIREKVGGQSKLAARDCAKDLLEKGGGPPSLAWVFADGSKDGSRIVEGLKEALPCPFIGGLAGDDRKFQHSYVFADGRAMEDAVVLLGARGSFAFAAHSSSGWNPIGRRGVVSLVHDQTIVRIDGKSAQAFFQEQLGKVPTENDVGLIPLAAYPSGDDDQYFLRTASHFDPVNGEAVMFGGIDVGTSVRVCVASREDVLKGVETVLTRLRNSGMAPCAAFLISCAARKWVLEDRCQEEVGKTLGLYDSILPLIGFPSFGEIGPFMLEAGRYSPSFFHNATLVVCLIGTKA